MGQRRQWGRRIIGLVGGLFVGLGLAELGARLLNPYPVEELFYGGQHIPPVGMYQFSAATIKEPTPGFDGTVHALSYKIRVRFNSLGVRGGEPSGDRKWLVVGDSFALGSQVREEETFEVRLGSLFGVEVLNGGVDDFSTKQASIRYTELAAKVDVDTVIALFFLGNDYIDNERYARPGPRPSAAAFAASPPVTLGRRLKSFVYNRSMLVSYAHVAVQHRLSLRDDNPRGDGFREQLAIYTFPGRPRLDSLLRPTRGAFEHLRDAARERNDRLLVVVAPPGFLIEPEALEKVLTQYGLPTVGTEAPLTLALSMLDELGIPSCDLTPALTTAWMRGDRPYLRFDGHWNATGHAVAAEVIASCLRAEDQL